VIHEVFSRLLAQEQLRASFHGGSFGAWLATVARNQALDYRRRWMRERPWSERPDSDAQSTEAWEEEIQARLLIDQFTRECLPAEWRDVFELRFLQQLSQREAATQLGLHRTTLAYRELRIRRLLKHFLLERDEP
jgi:RNA polymerase sigma-70 factor (ECF subfamily)